MSLADIIAKIKRDIRDIKASIAGLSPSSEIDTVHNFYVKPGAKIEAYRDLNQYQFECSPGVLIELQRTDQTTGTFLVGTAKVGYSDCG